MAVLKTIVATVAALSAPTVHAEGSTFVPACIAKQCGDQALALGRDGYVSAVTSCAAKSFGPCPAKAWQCLGDAGCRQTLTCGAKVAETCAADLWQIVNDPTERERLTCYQSCKKDGKIEPLCVALKCGKAAVTCLLEEKCREAALCPLEALMSCSKDAFGCVFSPGSQCRENLKCLVNGATQCSGPAVNLLTDAKIADFVECAGAKCPHPTPDAIVGMITPEIAASVEAVVEAAAGPAAGGPVGQLLCVAQKCSADVIHLATSQDTRDLLHCALKGELPSLCASAWHCLKDAECQKAATCLAGPLGACKGDVWKLLTDPVQRQRLEHASTCLRTCQTQHADNFVEATLCAVGTCGSDALACLKDDTCRGGLKCLPDALALCATPTLDAFVHQELFRNATQCLARGAESCGRGAVEMLRSADVARAVRCASQCTQAPAAWAELVVV